MKTSIQTITPDDARKLLEKNTENRPLRESWVEQLVTLIRDGKWATTHQGIALAKNGRVLDGQHRLHAILRANTPVQVLVTTGMDEDDYRWIDCGKARTTPDRLRLVDDPAVNRTCCSLVAHYLKCAKSGNVYSIDDVENTFLEMTDSFLYIGAAFSRPIKGITLAPVGAALCVYHHHHRDQGIDAAEALLHGRMLPERHPILVLREALIAQRVQGIHDQYWRTINACKAHLERRTMGNLPAAVEDFAGNTYTKLRHARTRKGLLAAQSRRKAS